MEEAADVKTLVVLWAASALLLLGYAAFRDDDPPIVNVEAPIVEVPDVIIPEIILPEPVVLVEPVPDREFTFPGTTVFRNFGSPVFPFKSPCSGGEPVAWVVIEQQQTGHVWSVLWRCEVHNTGSTTEGDG